MNNTEPLKIVCRNCRAKFDVTEFEPFTKFACPGCGTILRVPLRFDKYLLEKICGGGGMALVFRAIDPEFSRYVAVKVMNPEPASEPEVCKRFLEQAELVSRVDHPGLIPIYESGIANQQPYLVMKYMDIGNLEQLFHDQKLPKLPVLLAQLGTVAGGLQAAMHAGIIHHDVKPGNILMHSDDSIGLGDFDLADGPALASETPPVREWASPAYVSPEWLENGEEDYRGDIFSLGVTVYELVTGQLPYATDGDAGILLERRKHPLYLPASDINPDLSPVFSGFLGQMMAFRPEDRPGYPEIIRSFQTEARRIANDTGASGLTRFFTGFGSA